MDYPGETERLLWIPGFSHGVGPANTYISVNVSELGFQSVGDASLRAREDG
jgi:hypothetical protein